MMPYLETQSVAGPTLADRLAEGPIPLEEALRYATLLGQTLRDLHDTGKSHGGISPQTILLTPEGLELTSPSEISGPADIPGDMFAFGSVLAEILDGHASTDPDHGVADLIASCLASDRSRRPPNMRKALLELKVAGLSARHARRRAAERSDANAAFRAEVDALEMRLTQVQRNGEFQAAGLTTLESGVSAALQKLESRLAEAIGRIEHELVAQTTALEAICRSIAQTDDLIGRVVENFEAKLGAAHAGTEDNAARIDVVERGVRAAADQSGKLDFRLAEHVRQLHAEMESQASVVESVRKSMAQTDDLVGRVVEAVESVLDLNTARS